MPLHGIATAIYGTERKSTVSLATLVSKHAGDVRVDSARKMIINPSNTTQAREALLVVLNAACKYRAQMIDICKGKQAFVPLTIVHGVTEDHPSRAYIDMIRVAFPEYFRNGGSNGHSLSFNALMEQLFLQYYKEHGPRAVGDEQSAYIELHKYQLFQPDDEYRQVEYRVSDDERNIGAEFQKCIDAAERGEEVARRILVAIAQSEARTYANELRRRGILGKTRFVQFGQYQEEFKQCPRYTFLEWGTLRDVFAREFIDQLPEPHSVCVKTPNSKRSEPFADITTTLIEDIWDVIHTYKTGKVRPKRHVETKRD